MLRRTRVSRKPDVLRLGQALARPGIDTRVWYAIGFVVATHTDASGSFADVLLETGDELTCHVTGSYAGPGFGAYFPLDVDDTVLVEIPSGEPDNGGVVLGRLWSASDAPPQEAVDDPANAVIRMKAAQLLRIVAGDDVFIEWTPTLLNFNASVAVTKAAQSFGQQGVVADPTKGAFYFNAFVQHYYGATDLALPIPVPDSGTIALDPTVNNCDSSGVIIVSCPQNQSDIGRLKFSKSWDDRTGHGGKPPKVILTPCDAGAQAALSLVPPQIVIVDPATVSLDEFVVTVGGAAAMAAAALAPARYAYKCEG